MAKYLLLKHYRGAPAPVNDVPMDEWAPEEVSAHMQFMADFADRLVDDALALQRAGAFALVMEMVPAPVAAQVTKALDIPTIGIGAGPDCDAQVLVWTDMAGLNGGKAPRFVKRYADLRGVLRQAALDYADDVRGGTFPAPEHSFEE